jgi:hypothetical protein
MKARQRKSPEAFWQEYEEKTGEKVLARSLGQYVSGWDEFDPPPGVPIWGLIIATSGGFRFHHFPQANWLTALASLGSGDDPPKEKTIFIPSAQIVSAELRKETKWYRNIFSSNVPRLLIRYRNESGTLKELLLHAEHTSDSVVQALLYQDR